MDKSRITKPFGPNARAFFIFTIGAHITYMRVSERHDLLGIRRIGEDFPDIPVMAVLNTTSPTDTPGAPMDLPWNTLPSSSTNIAGLLSPVVKILSSSQAQGLEKPTRLQVLL